MLDGIILIHGYIRLLEAERVFNCLRMFCLHYIYFMTCVCVYRESMEMSAPEDNCARIYSAKALIGLSITSTLNFLSLEMLWPLER